MTTITCVADLHGYYPRLPAGDILIVAGDLTARDTLEEHVRFCEWLDAAPFRSKVVIAGNHDRHINDDDIDCLRGCYYLQDSFIICRHEEETFKIWGSPWTRSFPGMNPQCMAFTKRTDQELEERWRLIPKDTDILVTHGPAYNCLDETIDGENVGSLSLNKYLDWDAGLKLHIHGHIHEAYGHYVEQNSIFKAEVINASLMNEHYQPVNMPIMVTL